MPADPIILTLQLDEASAGFFQRQRDAYFPPALNRVPAHVTLFHKLPGEEERAVVEAVAGVCAGRQAFPVSVTGLRALGRGTAYTLQSRELDTVRADLARSFRPWLTGQDREGFRPHVTVQNKVSPREAKETYAELSSVFGAFEARAEGLQLWHYRGGPWSPAGAIAFG